jgi:hypothetical protein
MGGDASGGSVEGDHALINIGSGRSSSQSYSRFRLSFTIKGTAVTAAMPARGLLMPTALERRHILVQVERPPEGTLTAVRSSMSGPVRRPIFVFPREAEDTTITMGLSMFGLVRFLDITWLRLGTSKTGNGGDGGNAQSGNAFASGYGASAHSGPGGDASGGSVTGGRHDKVGRRGTQSLCEHRGRC